VKGKFLLSVFALILPASLGAQASKTTVTVEATSPFQRYEVFAGAAYSSANQVKGSSALIGANVGADAKLKRWFGGTADFGYYGASSGVAKPTVTTLMAGPEFYIPADNLTGFIHVLFGGAHTAGVGAKPDIAFAYGVGGGFNYSFSPKWALRVAGDGIVSSFVLDPTNQGYSPHARLNARATLGGVYRF